MNLQFKEVQEEDLSFLTCVMAADRWYLQETLAELIEPANQPASEQE